MIVSHVKSSCRIYRGRFQGNLGVRTQFYQDTSVSFQHLIPPNKQLPERLFSARDQSSEARIGRSGFYPQEISESQCPRFSILIIQSRQGYAEKETFIRVQVFVLPPVLPWYKRQISPLCTFFMTNLLALNSQEFESCMSNHLYLASRRLLKLLNFKKHTFKNKVCLMNSIYRFQDLCRLTETDSCISSFLVLATVFTVEIFILMLQSLQLNLQSKFLRLNFSRYKTIKS